MTVTFSEEVMQAMGFRAIAAEEAMVASFKSVTVFEARGVNLEPGTTRTASDSVSQISYGIAISPSANEGCMALLGDAFTDDEEQWRTEHKCTGPFVLIRVGPTREYEQRKVWWFTISASNFALKRTRPTACRNKLSTTDFNSQDS